VRIRTKRAAVFAVAVVVAAVGLAGIVWNQGPPREVVAALAGQTYQLRPGDTLRLPGIAASKVTAASKILTTVASQDPGSAIFRATDTGVAEVTATVACGSQSGVCPAWYGVVVTRQPPVDVAVSGVTSGTFVLRVGEQVIFGYAGVPVRSTSPRVLEPEGWPPFGPGPGLSLFRAVRPGEASLEFQGSWDCVDAQTCSGPSQRLSIAFIVSNSKSRFDHYASVRDAGTTIHLHKGQTVEVSFAPEPGFEPYQWQPWAAPMISGHVADQSLLDVGGLLTDPGTRYLRTQNGGIFPDRSGYLVIGLGTAEMAFKAAPIDCRPADECPRLDRTFELTIEVDS
jgi:hypothetical protein